MSTMLLKQQSTRDGNRSRHESLGRVQVNVRNGGIGGGSIGRERNGSRSAGAATMDSVAQAVALRQENSPARERLLPGVLPV